MDIIKFEDINKKIISIRNENVFLDSDVEENHQHQIKKIWK